MHYREAHIVFKPGKSRNGYFRSNKLLTQVDHAITILEGRANGLAQGLFMFDNAPSHMKRADDVISATKMVKSVSTFFFLSFSVSLISPKIPSIMTRRSHACTMASTP